MPNTNNYINDIQYTINIYTNTIDLFSTPLSIYLYGEIEKSLTVLSLVLLELGKIVYFLSKSHIIYMKLLVAHGSVYNTIVDDSFRLIN